MADAQVQNWTIGETLNGTIGGLGDQNSSVMQADLTLADIQAVPFERSCTLLVPGSEVKVYPKMDLDAAIMVERSRWDVNGDNKIRLEEVIQYLKILTNQ